jgi:hypothetical protein
VKIVVQGKRFTTFLNQTSILKSNQDRINPNRLSDLQGNVKISRKKKVVIQDLTKMREKTLYMSPMFRKKMSKSKWPLHYLKKGGKSEKPLKAYGKVEERLEQIKSTGRHKTTRDEQRMTRKEFVVGERGTLSICMVLIAAIFTLDASTPSGYSGCFLYILPLFFCLGLPNDRTVYGVAFIVTVLTIIAVPFEPSGNLSIDLFNRPVAIAGIWIVVWLGIQRRKFERDIEKKALELAHINAELQQSKEQDSLLRDAP